MIFTILGKQTLDFTTKDGQNIKGVNLYVGYKDQNTEGLKADKVFVRDGIAIPAEMKMNDKVQISFDNRGKVEQISLK